MSKARPVALPDQTAIAFLTNLTLELLISCQRRQFNNIDRLRFNYPSSTKALLKNKILGLAARLGFYRAALWDAELLTEALKTDGLAHAYGLLHDQFSKDLFIKLLAYRILGHQHVCLPLNNKKYWALRQSVDNYLEDSGTVAGIPILGSLDLFNFDGIRLHAHAMNIVNTFLLEQYRCERAGIGVKGGDVVIDAGGCWGDTALYFAQSAAQVFCFECMPSNIEIIEENLRMNPDLATKIKVIRKALWNKSQEMLAFQDSGPGSRPGSGVSAVDVETQTLDDFVSANSVERVDFIKMDIEGSEPNALIGAEQTIRSHRPQLALSIYHQQNHFALIPEWIASLGLGYRLYLDHFTIHAEETVLFARSIA
jgi:FkbM family methyltransferase